MGAALKLEAIQGESTLISVPMGVSTSLRIEQLVLRQA